jgi:hypothetical protein
MATGSDYAVVSDVSRALELGCDDQTFTFAVPANVNLGQGLW